MTTQGREEAVTNLFARTLHMWIKEAKFRFNVSISSIHSNICLALTPWKTVRTGGWQRRQSPAPVDPVPQWGRRPDKQPRGCHTDLTQTGPGLLIRDRQQSGRTRAPSRRVLYLQPSPPPRIWPLLEKPWPQSARAFPFASSWGLVWGF